MSRFALNRDWNAEITQALYEGEITVASHVRLLRRELLNLIDGGADTLNLSSEIEVRVGPDFVSVQPAVFNVDVLNPLPALGSDSRSYPR